MERRTVDETHEFVGHSSSDIGAPEREAEAAGSSVPSIVGKQNARIYGCQKMRANVDLVTTVIGQDFLCQTGIVYSVEYNVAIVPCVND